MWKLIIKNKRLCAIDKICEECEDIGHFVIRVRLFGNFGQLYFGVIFYFIKLLENVILKV